MTSAAIVLATLAAGCGDRSGLVPGDDASRVLADLDTLQSFVSSGDCEQVSQALQQLVNDTAQLPVSVDRELRGRIREGVEALSRQAGRACAQAKEENEPTETDTETQTETTSPETEPETTPGPETQPETTPTTDTTTTTTTTPTTETVPPPPTEGTGGALGEPGVTP